MKESRAKSLIHSYNISSVAIYLRALLPNIIIIIILLPSLNGYPIMFRLISLLFLDLLLLIYLLPLLYLPLLLYLLCHCPLLLIHFQPSTSHSCLNCSL